MAGKFNFERVLSNMQKVKSDLPVLLANQAQNYFAKPFKTTVNQGFDGVAWKQRKKETKKTIGKPILVSTGTLRRAVQNSIREKNFNSIKLIVNTSKGKGENYAKYINEGTDNMPQRQFMGDSKELRKEQRKLIINTIDKIWK